MKLSLSTTDLPVPVDLFARERDSAAFRTFLGKVCWDIALLGRGIPRPVAVLHAWTLVSTRQVLKRGSQTAWEEEWAEGEQRVVRLATSLDLSQYIPEHAQRQLEGICDHAQLREVLRYSSSPVAGGDHRAEVTITPPFIGNTVRSLLGRFRHVRATVLGAEQFLMAWRCMQAKVNLVVTVLPVDARTCRQALDADVEVSIPGIGESSAPRMHPHGMQERTLLQGPRACQKRACKGRLKSRWHAIGGVAEQSIADSLEQQYELLPEIVRRWAVFRLSLGAAKPGAEEQAGLLSRPPPLESLSADVRAELQVPALAPPTHVLAGPGQVLSAIALCIWAQQKCQG